MGFPTKVFVGWNSRQSLPSRFHRPESSLKLSECPTAHGWQQCQQRKNKAPSDRETAGALVGTFNQTALSLGGIERLLQLRFRLHAHKAVHNFTLMK